MFPSITRALGCLTALFLVVGIGGCATPVSSHASNTVTPTVVKGDHVTIDMHDSTFNPATIQVMPGTTVTWKNDDLMPHTVTSGSNNQPSGLFNSGDVDQGKTFSYKFTKAGSYSYFCTYHPSMVGQVVVDGNTTSDGNMSGMDMNSSDMAHGTSSSGSDGQVASLGTGSTGEPKQADDLRLLPYKMENGYKVFHLTAEPVKWQVQPGKTVDAWAYNGSVPGPEIKVDEGDKVKILVTNKLPEGTTVHWHGLDVPFSQDGTGGISQPDIKPGQTWTYTFTVNAPAGSYMYHSHPMNDMLKQENMGLFGPFIVEPKGTGWQQVHPGYQDEYTLMVNDSPEFGYTINGLSYPATPVLPAKVGDKVLVHLINIGAMDHPMHLHGMHFQELNQDGYPLPSPITMDTINTAPGTTYDLSFVANQPGKWLFHCHIAEHVTDSNGNMTGMVTMFDVK
ncbi:multicopper oxidase domain-containing protein [Alicyclobacillus dauci]|uniref:Multicopper oxidase domain-containing protein n=1 Tax=Alicyclobacillus dauci TaxID=1475485 RepID=A0ABY6Z4P8_9BACL|nr:multicopper oxidase domain-containing protein [Alicyclobacillus dauci]WAH37296.1 multicopper oxidase domain-containing protein [Alicyclobacillus dauci]